MKLAISRIAVAALLAAIVAHAPGVAAATTAVVSEQALAQYLTQTPPPGLIANSTSASIYGAERAAAGLDGARYAVVAPTYAGSDGNISYLRLANGQGAGGTAAKATTFSITVVGSPSGNTYGVARIEVAALASPQFSLQDILTRAGAGGLADGDTAYALYIQDTDRVAYQHVIYNGANGFFENVSICGVGGFANEPGGSMEPLWNVHTSALATYPSQVFLHNYQSQSAAYQVTVVDARTGATIGAVTLNTAANATYAMPETFFEESLHWAPGAGQQHANLILQEPASSQNVRAVMGQFIFNQKLAAYINMSVSCNINAPSSNSADTMSRYQGTLAGLGGQSGTLTVAIPKTDTGAAASAASAGAGAIERQSTIYEASGAMLLAGKSSVALVGTYNTATRGLTLVGGNFSFTGTISGGVIAGNYQGPNGISGGFSVATGSSTSILAYCGTYAGNPDSGVFNIQMSEAGEISGVTTPTSGGGEPTTLSGQMTSSTLSGSLAGGGREGTMQGTLQNGRLTGTFTRAKDGSTGSFTASTCPIPQPVVTYNGTVAGPFSQSGTISLLIEGSKVTGALALSGQPQVALTGAYAAATGTITLSGGSFTFTGQIVEEILAGTYTTPSITNGLFSTLNASQFKVSPYCGTYAGGHRGVWNVNISDSGGVSGEYSGTSAGTIKGQVAATGVSGTATESTGRGGAIFSGTFTLHTTSGTYRGADFTFGTFSGTDCPLPAL